MPLPLKTVTAIMALVVLISACKDSQHGRKDQSKNQLNTFACMPSVVRDSENIKIYLPDGHEFREMTVTTPDNTPFFLISDDSPIHNSPLMDSRDLLGKSQLELDVNTLFAEPAIYGKEEPVKVFSMVGTYTIRVGENLQTDDGSSFDECQVEILKES